MSTPPGLDVGVTKTPSVDQPPTSKMPPATEGEKEAILISSDDEVQIVSWEKKETGLVPLFRPRQHRLASSRGARYIIQAATGRRFTGAPAPAPAPAMPVSLAADDLDDRAAKRRKVQNVNLTRAMVQNSSNLEEDKMDSSPPPAIRQSPAQSHSKMAHQAHDQDETRASKRRKTDTYVANTKTDLTTSFASAPQGPPQASTPSSDYDGDIDMDEGMSQDEDEDVNLPSSPPGPPPSPAHGAEEMMSAYTKRVHESDSETDAFEADLPLPSPVHTQSQAPRPRPGPAPRRADRRGRERDSSSDFITKKPDVKKEKGFKILCDDPEEQPAWGYATEGRRENGRPDDWAAEDRRMGLVRERGGRRGGRGAGRDIGPAARSGDAQSGGENVRLRGRGNGQGRDVEMGDADADGEGDVENEEEEPRGRSRRPRSIDEGRSMRVD